VFSARWDSDRGFIQPAAFLLGRGGIVPGSMYASGPVGRMGADEAVRLITTRESPRLQHRSFPSSADQTEPAFSRSKD
jgi:hypothetical protein